MFRAQLQDELDQYSLSLTDARPTYGRGLCANKWVAEGEVIFDATCLWLDDKKKFREFLRQHQDDRDRAGVVQGVLREGEPVPCYFVLVGCATFMNHFSGLKNTPNAILTFNATNGVKPWLLASHRAHA